MRFFFTLQPAQPTTEETADKPSQSLKFKFFFKFFFHDLASLI